MEEIAKLLYRAYTKANFQEQYARSEELENAEKEFLGSLTKEQRQRYSQLEILLSDHIEERELRVIMYIFMLLTPEQW